MRAATVPSRLSLPTFVEPMLALLTPPFESDQHLFEVKWDGFRCLAFIDGESTRFVGRRKTDFTARFPELSALSKLPRGSVLDGEIVHFSDGRPDFAALLSRERSWSGGGSRRPRRDFAPVTFVAFDLLYDRFRPLIPSPLAERRDRLSRLLAKRTGPRLALSDGQIGDGLALFEKVNQMGLEGVVAKRLDGTYEPGRRSGSWAKFKRRQAVVCAIIGYEPDSTNGIKSLLLATEVDKEMRFVGQVGSGIGDSVHRRLLNDFRELRQPKPAVPCNVTGAKWLRPDHFCRVTFMEWTAGHKLRAPVFEALL